jgi:hypothetical protein
LAVPAFVAVAVTQGVVLYVASNFLLAPPPASFHTISGNSLPNGHFTSSETSFITAIWG